MAKNRIVRQERQVANLDDSDPTLGADVALVGGADDSVAVVAEDADGNPLPNEELGAEHDNDDWDQDAGKKKPPAARQEDEPAGDEEDARIAYDADSPDGDEGRRAGKRARRNRARRDGIAHRDAEIERLTGALGTMQRQLEQLQGGHISMAAHSIESQLGSAQQALAMADAELAKAVEAGDGKAFREVQTLRDEAAQRVYALSQARERIRTMPKGPPGNPDGRQTPPNVQDGRQQPLPVPPAQAAEAQRMANIFLDRNQWFDPQGTDRDSRVARQIDQELAEEGYASHQKAFWLEFERRTKEAGLGADYNDDDEDEAPPRRQQPAPRRNGGLPPTGAVRSSSRPGRGGFSLSTVQMDLLREEGLDGANLSKEDQAKKDRIITRWKAGAQAARRGGQV